MECLDEAANVSAGKHLDRALSQEDASQEKGIGCSGLVEARQLLYDEALEEGGRTGDEDRVLVC